MRIIHVVRVVTEDGEGGHNIEHVGPFEFQEAADHYVRLHVTDDEKVNPFTGVMEVEVPEGAEAPGFVTNEMGVQHGGHG